MTVETTEITNSYINLSTYETIGGLVLTYGSTLQNTYEISPSNTEVTITNTDLGLDTLNNIYFSITLSNEANPLDTETIGIYEICVENDKSSDLYNANNLKQDLDNLNYYCSVIESLTEKKDYLTANDMFNNFITTLQNFYGNNLLDSVSKSDVTGSCS